MIEFIRAGEACWTAGKGNMLWELPIRLQGFGHGIDGDKETPVGAIDHFIGCSKAFLIINEIGKEFIMKHNWSK